MSNELSPSVLDDFDWKSSPNLVQTFCQALDYLLVKTRKNIDQVFGDKLALKAFYFVSNALIFHNDPIEPNVIKSRQVEKLLGSLVAYLYENRKSIDFGRQDENDLKESIKNAERLEQPHNLLMSFKCVLSVTNILLKNVDSFKHTYFESDGFQAHFNFLSDPEFVSICATTSLMITDYQIQLLDHFISNVDIMLLAVTSSNRIVWKKMDGNNKLIRIAKLVPNEYDKLILYKRLACLVDSQQIETLDEMKKLLEVMAKSLVNFHNILTKNSRTIQRQKHPLPTFEDEQDTDKKPELFGLFISDEKFSLCSFMDILNNMLLNEESRYFVYTSLNVRPFFKTILSNGNLEEILLTLKVLVQFVFNQKIASEIKNDPDYLTLVEELTRKDSFNNEPFYQKQITNAATLIKFNLDNCIMDNSLPPVIRNLDTSEVRKWNRSQVETWFEQNSLNKSILNEMKTVCNGEILEQLAQIKNRAPEFFYQSISKSTGSDLSAVAHFSLCLDKLFGNL